MGVSQKLAGILRISSHRRLAAGIGAVYLVLFLIALQDITLGGASFQFITTEVGRMFDRRAGLSFEPVAMLTFPGALGLPGVTVLLSPLNVLLGVFISALVGLNLMITCIAFRQPKACSFYRSTGILASVPALLAGGACCAPAIVLILGLQVSTLMISTFQIQIPVSVVVLLVTLKLILDRTDAELLAAT